MSQDYSQEKITNNELDMKLDNFISIFKEHTTFVKEEFSNMKERQNLTNGNVIKNTEFRLTATATFLTLKWLVGLIGAGTLFNVIINYSRLFTK